jgi:carbon storage regulator
MLVLTRRVGDRLRIGPDIEVVVLEIRGREVRLGVSAPATVAIQREELYRRVQEANRAAALKAPVAESVARAARTLRGKSADTGTSCGPSSAR